MASITFRPEDELLLGCVSPDLEAQRRERIGRLLAAELDWPGLLKLADLHGLRPLLFRHLHEIAPEAVPKAIYAELWSRHQALARRNQAMADELIAILRLLDAEGIPAIPYKGPMLALEAYGDLALREFGDLDLLVRRADVLRARAVLATMGYRDEHPLRPAVETAFLHARANYHLALIRGERERLVELHWKTDPEFPVEPSQDDRWWSSLATTRLGEQDVRCFSPEELLLVLCLHGSKHFWASLGWLVDVAELIRKQPALDWAWIIARAEQLQASRRLALGLHLLRSLLEIPLPESVRSWLSRQTEAQRLAETLVPSLFDPEAQEPGALRRLRINFELYETGSQRLRHAVDVVLSPTLVEWTRWPLPRPLFFLYLPLRLGRLIGKYVFGRGDPA